MKRSSQEKPKIAENGLGGGGQVDYTRSMLKKYEVPDSPSPVKIVLATNKEQIFERLNSGVPMKLALEELIETVTVSKVKFPTLHYSTFRRFVNRERAKTTVQPPAVTKAINEPTDEGKALGVSPIRSTPPLPIRKPRIGPDGVDFSGTDTAEELFGPAPPKSHSHKII